MHALRTAVRARRPVRTRLGPSAARNTGITAADGEYIAP